MIPKMKTYIILDPQCTAVVLLLTLMRATSGSLARCRGGWLPPPLSILALEQLLAQKSSFPTSRHQFQLISLIFRIFFPKFTEKLAKIENLPKNC